MNKVTHTFCRYLCMIYCCDRTQICANVFSGNFSNKTNMNKYKNDTNTNTHKEHIGSKYRSA